MALSNVRGAKANLARITNPTWSFACLNAFSISGAFIAIVAVVVVVSENGITFVCSEFQDFPSKPLSEMH